MSLRLSARYPDLIASASAFNSDPDFYAGDKGRRLLWRPKDHTANYTQSMIRLAPDALAGVSIPLILSNESWSFHFTPDVRYGLEKLYQAFQMHTRHLHPYELRAPAR